MFANFIADDHFIGYALAWMDVLAADKINAYHRQYQQ